MFWGQNIQDSVTLCIRTDVIIIIFVCVRTLGVMDLGNWREQFYPPSGAMVEPRGGLGYHKLILSHLASHPNHLRKPVAAWFRSHSVSF